LTPELVAAIAERVAAGEPLGTAAKNVGASPRSLRRWRQTGREQLQALGLEGRLEQRLALAFERAQGPGPEDWQTIAARPELRSADRPARLYRHAHPRGARAALGRHRPRRGDDPAALAARAGRPDARPAQDRRRGARDIPILPALRRRLIEHRLASPWTRPGDPVFAATSGNPKAYRNVRRAIETVGDELELDLRSHDFRRSLASYLIVAARADEAAVTHVMGHANIETTRRIYAGDWREAEERNALVLRQLAEAGIGQ
jgi:integrase